MGELRGRAISNGAFVEAPSLGQASDEERRAPERGHFWLRWKVQAEAKRLAHRERKLLTEFESCSSGAQTLRSHLPAGDVRATQPGSVELFDADVALGRLQDVVVEAVAATYKMRERLVRRGDYARAHALNDDLGGLFTWAEDQVNEYRAVI